MVESASRVHRVFIAHAERWLTDPGPVRVLGIDAARRGKLRWEYCKDTSRRVVDLSGSQGLLGQKQGRTTAAVVGWLTERTPALREAIEYVAIDPAAVRTEGLLPNATLVVHHFRLVQLGNDAVTKVRRRVTWELKDRRGGKIDPAWTNCPRVLTGQERLSNKNLAKIWNTILEEDPSAQILSAYIAKEKLRTLLSTVRVGGDSHLTRRRLPRFLTWCIDSRIPELLTLAKTVDAWWPANNAFVLTWIIEGHNRLVKAVKRAACGFRNRENSAPRTRFHCTRTQRAATQTSCLLPDKVEEPHWPGCWNASRRATDASEHQLTGREHEPELGPRTQSSLRWNSLDHGVVGDIPHDAGACAHH